MGRYKFYLCFKIGVNEGKNFIMLLGSMQRIGIKIEANANLYTVGIATYCIDRFRGMHLSVSPLQERTTLAP